MKQKLMTKRLIIFVMMLLPMRVFAENISLIVELANGHKVNYLLRDKPVMTMDGTKLVIETVTIQTNYERADVSRFYFEKDPSEVKELPKNSLRFKQTDTDIFEISGLPQDEHITIFDTAGFQCGSISFIGSSSAIVNLSGLRKGAYLIKIGKIQTIKFVKK